MEEETSTLHKACYAPFYASVQIWALFSKDGIVKWVQAQPIQDPDHCTQNLEPNEDAGGQDLDIVAFHKTTAQTSTFKTET